MTDDDSRPAEPARVNQLDRVKSEYTQAAREILARSMRGVAKTKLTPDMLEAVFQRAAALYGNAVASTFQARISGIEVEQRARGGVAGVLTEVTPAGHSGEAGADRELKFANTDFEIRAPSR